MLVLGIESSTPVASVAVVSAEGLKGEITLNIGLTHSEQLLPIIDELFRQTRISLKDVQGIAVAGGPGSFTGLRIGMATAKGLAQGSGIPLISVPTLEALACNYIGAGTLVSPMLNARKQEIYTALYRFSLGRAEKLIADCAATPKQWADKLAAFNEPVILAGDGAFVYQENWQSELKERAVILPLPLAVSNAVTVAWLGREKLLTGKSDDLYTLKPVYIRLAEAQVKLVKANKQGVL